MFAHVCLMTANPGEGDRGFMWRNEIKHRFDEMPF
jgi:hypothetical protein